jgi:uncharacterized protein YbjT (DUF2867 family)
MNTNRELTLVEGGTGKTGRRVVQRLEDRNLPFRIGSRSAAPAFDWQKPATWGPALQNATSTVHSNSFLFWFALSNFRPGIRLGYERVIFQ